MRGKLLGLVPVADGSGPEFDLGELVTWLNDAIMFAPSMLLGAHARFAATGSDDEFDVTVTDRGRTVTARVYLDTDGAPRDFGTEDRWAALSGGLVRARWTTPVSGCRPGRRTTAAGGWCRDLAPTRWRVPLRGDRRGGLGGLQRLGGVTLLRSVSLHHIAPAFRGTLNRRQTASEGTSPGPERRAQGVEHRCARRRRSRGAGDRRVTVTEEDARAGRIHFGF